MTISSSLLLAALFIAGGTAATDNSTYVSDPHKYFTEVIRQAAEKADAVSPDAIPYPAKYPTIDIHPWLDPASSTEGERREVVYQVLEQAIGAGSFNIVGHGVTVELLDRLESSAKLFFSQSIDFKRQFITDHPKTGYVANLEEKYGTTVFKSDNPYENEGDMREIFGFMYPPDLSANIQAPEYFQSVLNAYIDQLQPVGLTMSKIFSAALSLAKGTELPSTYLHESDSGLLRALHYPSMPSEYGDANRLVPHMDFGTMTILYSAAKGLDEIRDGRWVEVPIDKSKGELHVNIGEMYTMMSNGLFKGNVHRVSKDAAKDRISFAYFVGQGQAASGEGVEPVCSEGEVPRFPRSSSSQHVGAYITKMLEGESLAE